MSAIFFILLQFFINIYANHAKSMLPILSLEQNNPENITTQPAENLKVI